MRRSGRPLFGVLGAGTMGSRIAAHFANAGVPVLLLDLDDRARKGIENALRQKPAGFFVESAAALVTPGNFEDDLAKIAECDWIVEAVAENLEIKRKLWARVAALRTPGTIVSTNTSGIPLAKISEGFPPEFRRNFLGTHFFNPPRYLHLVEMIPGAETDPEVFRFVADFCDRRLGKGVVPCKDTPNFIANRIGSFFGATAYQIMMEEDYTIEEVDALTGPLIGLPNSATFRLVDIIGLDVWSLVARNVFDAATSDPWRERFRPPDYQLCMMERGWLGDKSGQGFYQRIGKGKDRVIHAIDWKTLEYHPARKADFPSAANARKIGNLPERLRALAASSDRAGTLLWKLFRDLLLYSAERVPEISDRIVEIDRAMRWGYAHSLGPFELWDALGFRETARRIEKEGRQLPPSVEAMLSSGAESFYRPADADGQPHTEYFDFLKCSYQMLEERPGVIELAPIRRARGVVQCNAGASLIDLGDGALCLEFHGRMNLLGEDEIAMIHAGLEETERNFRAMVIANQGEVFSGGADLAPLLEMARKEQWTELDSALKRRQEAAMAVKYAARPVVAAPFSRTLGSACDLVLHAARAQASAELSMSFQEAGAGLIPFWGGTKELLLRTGDARRTFDLIALPQTSSSAADAMEKGLIRGNDGISMNPERLIGDAKALALSLAAGYSPGRPPGEIQVAGDGGEALLQAAEWLGQATEQDRRTAQKLASILSGGAAGSWKISEQALLDLEREAALSLFGAPLKS